MRSRLLTRSAGGALPAHESPAPAAKTAAPKGPTLGDVRSLSDLEALFAADRGKYRIVLLLSPT